MIIKIFIKALIIKLMETSFKGGLNGNFTYILPTFTDTLVGLAAILQLRPVKFNFKDGHEFSNLINNENFKRIFDSKIMDNISKSFGAAFGTGISSRNC